MMCYESDMAMAQSSQVVGLGKDLLCMHAHRWTWMCGPGGATVVLGGYNSPEFRSISVLASPLLLSGQAPLTVLCGCCSLRDLK